MRTASATAVARSFAADVSARLGPRVTVVDNPREAVSGCDLVVTAGPILKKPHATILPGWLEVGAFASLVDFDSYWHPAALREASKFCTEDVPQFMHHKEIGYFQDVPPIYANLGELVAAKKPGRQGAAERTMACNLGLALDDMAVAPTIMQRALAGQIGQFLNL
jgi:ornithine cyclodeaminase/alanine dehydrogenase-like protein (mu-crystallin family)